MRRWRSYADGADKLFFCAQTKETNSSYNFALLDVEGVRTALTTQEQGLLNSKIIPLMLLWSCASLYVHLPWSLRRESPLDTDSPQLPRTQFRFQSPRLYMK